MEFLNDKCMRQKLVKYLNNDFYQSEEEYFFIKIKEIDELNKKYKKLDLELVCTICPCELNEDKGKYENYSFYLYFFLGFNLSNESKTFF